MIDQGGTKPPFLILEVIRDSQSSFLVSQNKANCYCTFNSNLKVLIKNLEIPPFFAALRTADLYPYF